MVLSVTEHALQYGMLPDVPVRTMTEHTRPVTASIIVQLSTSLQRPTPTSSQSLFILTASLFIFVHWVYLWYSFLSF